MIIAVDFDGTVVRHEYPKVGEDCPDAVRVLKRLTDAGHHLILFTMRSGNLLEDAVIWFKDRDIPLYGVQTNPDQKSWTTSPKAHADLYIDDSSLGAIITADILNGQIMGRPYIDWEKVDGFLQAVYNI